jgi:peroxiredoxin
MRRESDTLRAGSAAPPFAIADQDGRTRSLNEFLTSGPLLLIFDRGTW